MLLSDASMMAPSVSSETAVCAAPERNFKSVRRETFSRLRPTERILVVPGLRRQVLRCAVHFAGVNVLVGDLLCNIHVGCMLVSSSLNVAITLNENAFAFNIYLLSEGSHLLSPLGTKNHFARLTPQKIATYNPFTTHLATYNENP